MLEEVSPSKKNYLYVRSISLSEEVAASSGRSISLSEEVTAS
jgi:hypothetical protein